MVRSTPEIIRSLKDLLTLMESIDFGNPPESALQRSSPGDSSEIVRYDEGRAIHDNAPKASRLKTDEERAKESHALDHRHPERTEQ